MFQKLSFVLCFLLIFLAACTPTTTDVAPTAAPDSEPTTPPTAVVASPTSEPTVTPTAVVAPSYEEDPPHFTLQTADGEWVTGYFGGYQWNDTFVTAEYFEHKGPFQLNPDGQITIDIESQRPLNSVTVKIYDLVGQQHASFEQENPVFPLTLEQTAANSVYELSIFGYWDNEDETSEGFKVFTPPTAAWEEMMANQEPTTSAAPPEVPRFFLHTMDDKQVESSVEWYRWQELPDNTIYQPPTGSFIQEGQTFQLQVEADTQPKTVDLQLIDVLTDEVLDHSIQVVNDDDPLIAWTTDITMEAGYYRLNATAKWSNGDFVVGSFVFIVLDE